MIFEDAKLRGINSLVALVPTALFDLNSSFRSLSSTYLENGYSNVIDCTDVDEILRTRFPSREYDVGRRVRPHKTSWDF